MVCPTTADIAMHGILNLLLGGMGITFQQRRRRHDLTGLAITALRHVHFVPGELQGMITVFRQPFDGGDGGIFYRRYPQLTGTHRIAIKMNGAGTALANAATKLGAGQPQMIAQHPEHRGIISDIYRMFFSVDVYVVLWHKQNIDRIKFLTRHKITTNGWEGFSFGK